MSALNVVARPGPVTVASGLAFVLFVAAGVGHALMALYGSGQPVARLEVQHGSIVSLPGVTISPSGPRATQVGPIELSPSMNPLRIVLHAGYTPRAGNRIRYRTAMLAADGTTVWEQQGFLDGGEEASSVDASHVVRTFDVRAPGLYAFEIEFGFMTLDDLRTASLEVRRNVQPVNRTWVTLCTVLAAAALVVNLATRPPAAAAIRAPERRAA